MGRNFINISIDKIKFDDVLNVVTDKMPNELLVIIRDHTQGPMLCSGVRITNREEISDFLTNLSLHIRKRKNPEDRWEHWEPLDENGCFDNDRLEVLLNSRNSFD